jgi:hypothetical protein
MTRDDGSRIPCLVQMEQLHRFTFVLPSGNKASSKVTSKRISPQWQIA